MSAINKWSIDKVRHTTEEKGPRSYKSRNSAKANKSLSDDDSYSEEDNISENERRRTLVFF